MKFCCSTARSTGGGISAGRLTLGWVLTLWKCLIDICNVPRLSGESFLDDLLKIEIVHLKSTFLEEKWFRFFLFRREGLTALRRRLPSNGRDNFIEELKSFAKGNEAYGGDVEVFQQRFSALTLCVKFREEIEGKVGGLRNCSRKKDGEVEERTKTVSRINSVGLFN